MAVIVQNDFRYSTNMLMIVYSTRLGGKFECHRFREYSIEIDLETDSDTFDFVFKNPDSVYTSLFSKFDVVEIMLQKKGVFKGRIDTVEYIWDAEGSYIHVAGRDIMAPLVDSNVLPATRQSVKPASYIAEKASEYGIAKTKLDQSMAVLPKLVTNIGETEISVIATMCGDANKKIWLDYDTLCTGDWNMSAPVSYTFTRGLPLEKTCIPIKSMKITEEGSTVPSEIIVYGTTTSGDNKVIGTFKNDYMTGKGIKRRITIGATDNNDTQKFVDNAKFDIRDKFDNSVEVTITVATKDILIVPNTVAHIIDMNTRTNCLFFIKKVKYSKNLTDGSMTEITMIPNKSASDVLWAGQGTRATGGVTGYAAMKLNDLLSSRKG